ncbi:hypothetical protein R1flu_019920 [Riccia fluitans]|uniref:Uncharacterized protein n=1 Tax=Riccia fluitans TaxID=41844 RepID=A0ABD1ZKG2_9MARC
MIQLLVKQCLNMPVADDNQVLECLEAETADNHTAPAALTLEDLEEIEVTRKFPKHLTRLGDLTVADAYYEFVRGGLSNCITSGLKKQEYNALCDPRKIYSLARKLEPSFLDIVDLPVFHGELFCAWHDRVRPQIQYSSSELQKKIDQHQNTTKEGKPNSVIHNCKTANKCLASIKRMRVMAELHNTPGRNVLSSPLQTDSGKHEQ